MRCAGGMWTIIAAIRMRTEEREKGGDATASPPFFLRAIVGCDFPLMSVADYFSLKGCGILLCGQQAYATLAC